MDQFVIEYLEEGETQFFRTGADSRAQAIERFEADMGSSIETLSRGDFAFIAVYREVGH